MRSVKVAKSKQHLLIFLNPTAGSGRAGLFYPYLKRILSIRNIAHTTIRTGKKGDINSYISSFASELDKRFTGIVAMGGDGTTWEALSSLVKFNVVKIPVSIFPFGSGNDLARSLHIPLYNPRGALETVLNGEKDTLDICSVNGHYFANYIAFGFEGEILMHRELEQSTLPGYTSYVKPFVKAIENLKYNLYHLKFQDREVDVIGMTCIISNIPSHYGGVKLVQEANSNDGIFEITIIKKVPSIRTFLKAPFLHGKALDSSEYVRYRTDRVTISFDDDVPALQVDGEAFQTFENKFEIGIKKGILPIIRRRN